MDLNDNLEEYADPAFYDYEHKDFEPYGPFYLALANRLAGSILVLGCGTGRVAIPLAQQGFDVTGLDIIPEMLAFASQKVPQLSINWIQADARSFRLADEFDLIIEPGCVFQHMLTNDDQQAMLWHARQHLSPSGVFVLALVFPRVNMMANSGAEEYWFSYENKEGQEVRVSGTDHYDPLTQVRTETAYRR